MSNLKDQLIKLGSKRKDLRPHIRPVLAELEKEASFMIFSDRLEQMLDMAIDRIVRQVPVGLKFEQIEADGDEGEIALTVKGTVDRNKEAVVSNWWVYVQDLQWKRNRGLKLEFSMVGRRERGSNEVDTKGTAQNFTDMGGKVAKEITKFYENV